MKTLTLLALLSHLLVGYAHAVVVLSGGPNNTAPSGQPYYGNVGSLNGASAVYLGNRWVMTATHVAGSLPGSVNFGGMDYNTVGGSYQNLTNNGTGGMSATTDIALFRLSSDPGLPWVNLTSTVPVAGTVTMMIGNGRIQQSSLSYWDVTVVAGPDNNIWTEVAMDAYDATGFKTTDSHQVRWGVNSIETIGLNVNATYGDVRSFSTFFGGSVVFEEEAQAVVGDSGGAVFSLDGSNWILSGMMHAISRYDNQPANTAIIGQSTFAADLSFYRNQILTITEIPEPGSSTFLIISACGMIARRQRLNN